MTATETKTTITGLLQAIRTKTHFNAAYAMLLDLLEDEGHPFAGATRDCTAPSAGLSWMMERYAVLAGLCDWTDCPAHMEAVAYENTLNDLVETTEIERLYDGNDRELLASLLKDLLKCVGLKGIRDIKVKTPKHGQPYVTMRVPRRSDVANRDYTKLHQLLAMAFPGAINNATQFCWYMN